MSGHKIEAGGFTGRVEPCRRESDTELLAAAGSDPGAFARFYDRYETMQPAAPSATSPGADTEKVNQAQRERPPRR
jgi:hypothetical protein